MCVCARTRKPYLLPFGSDINQLATLHNASTNTLISLRFKFVSTEHSIHHYAKYHSKYLTVAVP